jgi:ATP-dependent RNA helicase DeaD
MSTTSPPTPESEAPFAHLPTPIAAALEKRGFRELTAIQRTVLELIRSEDGSTARDLRISSQTGSGKTVAIGLALASHFQGNQGSTGPRPATAAGDFAARPTALVIVPTRELAAQVRDELGWLYAGLPDLKVEVVTGGTSILMERRALARKPALVVGTPGRLLDHMRNGALACDAIAHVVLDEADQMLDMGFREELEAIVDALPASRASHLVSATFPRAVLELAGRFQKNPLALEGTRLGVANVDIQHIAYAIRRHETYPALVNVLLLAGDSRCLLFVNRRVDAVELAEKLASDGFAAAPFSGELPQAQRTRTLNAFRNGTFHILVSTDVAARGIDVPDISTVIHVDPPRTADAYTHRSGRTGRAGRAGRSILLVVGPESQRVTRLLRSARVEASWQPIPGADKVRKALTKQARRDLHERLAVESSEAAPDDVQLTYAKKLLEEQDPAHLVGTLLAMAMPSPPIEPQEVVGLDPFAERQTGRSVGRSAERASDRRGPRQGGRGGEEARTNDFTRFIVSWGEQSGATASRLLSHVCRRGGLSSRQVGAIRIDAETSTVEVARTFETRTRRPDERDPGIVIHPASGSADDVRRKAPRGPGAATGTSRRPPSGPARGFRPAAARREARPGSTGAAKRKPIRPATGAKAKKKK